MSQRSLASVLLKVLGVVSIIKAIEFAASAIMMVFSSYGFGRVSVLELLQAYLPILAPFVMFVVIAFILLRYANSIAAKLFPSETSAFSDDSVPTDQWYVLAFTVLGVGLLVWYVPVNIAICVGNFLFIAGHSEGQFGWEARRSAWNGLIQIVLQLGLGFYLILGSRKIVAILRKLRRQ